MRRPEPFGTAAAAVVGLALAACTAGAPAIEAPDVPTFERAELIDVGEPDAVPAVRAPELSSIEDAASWLTDDGPVVVVEVGGEARAYPLAILAWHEVVNDEIAGAKVVVTYSPLVNAAAAYERELRGSTLTFVPSGKLYHSDLVLLDLRTKSLWLQLTGAGVLGPMKGTSLQEVPSALVSFGEYRRAYPDGRVLVRPQGRTYGTTPYPGYDSRDGPIEGFFGDEVDARLPPMARVLGVRIGSAARAYPVSAGGADPSVLHDRLGDADIVVFGTSAQRSALDQVSIADGARVGSARAFRSRLGDRRLRFRVAGGEIRDVQTGSTWTIFGLGVAGPLTGEHLEPVRQRSVLWFAWAAFVPNTDVGATPDEIRSTR